MAAIKVRDLTSITGTDLFNDLENFMKDLSDDEFTVLGGGTPAIVIGVYAAAGIVGAISMAAYGGWFRNNVHLK